MDSIEENFSKHFSSEEKKVVIALWKAKVPLKTVREQCKISEDQRIKEIKRRCMVAIFLRKILSTSQFHKLELHTITAIISNDRL
jgi:hypothetical protein